MLDFVNYFFSLFAEFVSMLFRLEIADGLSVGNILVATAMLLLILSFLYRTWIDTTFGGSDGDE